MNIVSNQSEKWVKLIFSFFMVQDDIQIPPTDNRYGAVDNTSGLRRTNLDKETKQNRMTYCSAFGSKLIKRGSNSN